MKEVSHRDFSPDRNKSNDVPTNDVPKGGTSLSDLTKHIHDYSIQNNSMQRERTFPGISEVLNAKRDVPERKRQRHKPIKMDFSKHRGKLDAEATGPLSPRSLMMLNGTKSAEIGKRLIRLTEKASKIDEVIDASKAPLDNAANDVLRRTYQDSDAHIAPQEERRDARKVQRREKVKNILADTDEALGGLYQEQKKNGEHVEKVKHIFDYMLKATEMAEKMNSAKTYLADKRNPRSEDHEYQLVEKGEIILNVTDRLAGLKSDVETLQRINHNQIANLNTMNEHLDLLKAQFDKTGDQPEEITNAINNMKQNTAKSLQFAEKERITLQQNHQDYSQARTELVNMYNDYLLEELQRIEVSKDYHPYFPKSLQSSYDLSLAKKEYYTTDLPDGCLTGSTKMLYHDYTGKPLSWQDEIRIHTEFGETGNKFSDADKILNNTIPSGSNRYESRRILGQDSERAKNELAEALSHGDSVIVMIKKEGMGGHAIVVDSLVQTDHGTAVNIRDPYSPHHQAYSVSYEEFAQRWSEYNPNIQNHESTMIILKRENHKTESE